MTKKKKKKKKKKKDAESSRPRVASWVLRPKAPPLWLGIVVAAGLIALETILVLALERFTDENAYGALFLLGVLVISANWGFGLAVAATVVSAAVYTSFHMGPDGFNPVKTQDWFAILIFVPIALLANVLVGQARLRAAEADHRPREAEASKEELRVTAEQLASSRARIVRRPMMRGAASNATFMTGHSSGCSRWGSSCAWRSRRCGRRPTRSPMTSQMSSPG